MNNDDADVDDNLHCQSQSLPPNYCQLYSTTQQEPWQTDYKGAIKKNETNRIQEVVQELTLLL